MARICGGRTAREFRGWHGFAADTRLEIFEGGTDLRRTHRSGVSRVARICPLSKSRRLSLPHFHPGRVRRPASSPPNPPTRGGRNAETQAI
ncbi:hypothetical protein SBA3_100064 [Candidatus Sulfopaludibacter sp. SbA3]|nr:hypothetical protein SBA3_100064 [Candidatus Sulfopaludibacter sp. SbA3]